MPDRATIKEVTFKKETTGEWFVSFGLETDDANLPEKPDVDSLDASNSVGIDLGILNYVHTSDGKTVDWLVREYDAVFIEDSDLKGMLEQSHNARNKQDAAWRQFITFLEYKAKLYGTHVVQVEARGTTKECARCGVEAGKPIWVRERFCPSCGFECDRDANAAMNVLRGGFSELGLGWPEDTPVETALPTDTTSVSAKRVVETGSLVA